jgi:hypothetical protein
LMLHYFFFFINFLESLEHVAITIGRHDFSRDERRTTWQKYARICETVIHYDSNDCVIHCDLCGYE